MYVEGGAGWDEGEEEAIVFRVINGADRGAADLDSQSMKLMKSAWNMIYAMKNTDQLVTATANSFQG
ncbi:hypothetical protein BHE18_11660 [Rossellomorea aquimaris]|jgi:hypothetical protein|uniref:Uncharacterized protein n=1 Tax=Rossellomorea aquimaris TaxID=189382 RepID=A0A1J6VYJ3_9BACI|nr:hypothetical protein BHE18_11660 [Rossellomorea aquimaris]